MGILEESLRSVDFRRVFLKAGLDRTFQKRFIDGYDVGLEPTLLGGPSPEQL